MASLPPEKTNPSGYVEDGGRKVIELMKAEPCERRLDSNEGGFDLTSSHF